MQCKNTYIPICIKCKYFTSLYNGDFRYTICSCDMLILINDFNTENNCKKLYGF